MTGKYLITTDSYFFAGDGKQYKAVWGDVTIVEDTFLGIKTNRNASNWYAKVGTEDNHVIVAGCQIHYALKTKTKPFIEYGEDWTFDPQHLNVVKTPTKIYIAE